MATPLLQWLPSGQAQVDKGRTSCLASDWSRSPWGGISPMSSSGAAASSMFIRVKFGGPTLPLATAASPPWVNSWPRPLDRGRNHRGGGIVCLSRFDRQPSPLSAYLSRPGRGFETAAASRSDGDGRWILRRGHCRRKGSRPRNQGRHRASADPPLVPVANASLFAK